MKRKILIIVFIGLLSLTSAIDAKLRVLASYNYIADLVEKIGGDNVKVTPLAKGYKDPHYVTPRPSFIAKMRKADLLIINGGQLEIGWIPPILKKANNPRVNPGNKGFLDLFSFIEGIDIPKEISRAHGDVHPDGNPHFHLDPENILIISGVIRDKLIDLDLSHKELFIKRHKEFTELWQKKMIDWGKTLEKFSGKNVVQYHKNFDYFLKRFNMKQLGTLEPVPGIPPSTRHILEMIEIINNKGAEFIIHDVYHMKKPSRFVNRKTGVKLVILPHDVGSVDEATDIVSLFDEIVRRLLK
ncbi:MAG: zinc ABC transporter substrate-binding protein [Candidatus Aminicenantes bacterium]|nr:zinc ABC transporter substrate-binding protein [Candidatus Aminicenantes bacterium]